MDANAAAPWPLPERLTLETVGGIHAQWLGKETAIGDLDLSGVNEIDSAGVALLHWLRGRQRTLGRAPSRVREDAAGRYRALCRAHRLDDMAG
ncbi:MAG: hypothetical protein OZ919_09980 [Xanthomonadaceae bacterium]|nr:hypothetical protein [Xanthomonadaceae bacterium]